MVYTLTLETASLMVKVGLAHNHDNFLFYCLQGETGEVAVNRLICKTEGCQKSVYFRIKNLTHH